MYSIGLDTDPALTAGQNHDRAAVALCQRQHWPGSLVRITTDTCNFYLGPGIKSGYAKAPENRVPVPEMRCVVCGAPLGELGTLRWHECESRLNVAHSDASPPVG